MELSMSLTYLRKMRGSNELRSLESAAQLCRDAGFRYVDFTPEYRDDDWEAMAYHAREVLDRLGILVEQTHAPYNRYASYEQDRFPEYADGF